MFKVNIKNTRTSFRGFYRELLAYFTPFWSVSINVFEQINVSLELSQLGCESISAWSLSFANYIQNGRL